MITYNKEYEVSSQSKFEFDRAKEREDEMTLVLTMVDVLEIINREIENISLGLLSHAFELHFH